jgi:UDP-galactopyranose mutase
MSVPGGVDSRNPGVPPCIWSQTTGTGSGNPEQERPCPIKKSHPPDYAEAAVRAHPTIVCLSNLDWGYLRYRKQHLMERLARRLDVVYVNPPRAVKARQWPFRRRTTQVTSSLWVHEPFVMPAMIRSGTAKRITYEWLTYRLKPWKRRARPFVLWLYSPHGLPFIDLLRPDLVVYDVADLYATPGGARLRDGWEKREIETLADLEDRLLPRADLVLCVSEPLAERIGSRARRVHLVPNGCDWGRYAHMNRPATPLRGARPRLGFVGSLAPRVNFELIAGIAGARPDWRIELVGPVSPLADLSSIQGCSNVCCTGEVRYEDVPARIASYDVCLLPLHEIDSAYFCSPIQVYDYLAAGKPVVSTPVGQLERLHGLVHVARDWKDFVCAVEKALDERDQAGFLRRRNFAERNSWDCRIRQIMTLLDDAGVALCQRAREVDNDAF